MNIGQLKDVGRRLKIARGRRLKIARKASGFTQKQIADYLGVSQSLVSKFERGIRFMKLTSYDVDRLCTLLYCREEWLVYGIEPSGLDDKPRINICYIKEEDK